MSMAPVTAAATSVAPWPPRTWTAAAPKPIEVSTFRDTAMNEHIPRKNASAMFSTKIAFVARLR